MDTITPKKGKRLPLPARAWVGIALAVKATLLMSFLGIVGSIQTPGQDEFRFTRGTTFAPGEESRLRGFISAAASEGRILFRITGHTGTQGDEAANMQLSTERAQEARRIALEMGIPANRISWSGGVGGGQPLQRSSDVSPREWERDLSRVTIETKVRP